ncbi:MAG: efflux RND transporter periplasmic adaptor subunit [bacterium]
MKKIYILLTIVFLLIACESGDKEKGSQKFVKRVPEVQTVAAKPVEVVFDRSFLVTLEPWRQTEIASKATGYVTKVVADRGDFVSSGERLAFVETEDLTDQKESAEVAVEAAQTAFDSAKKNFERAETLFEKEFISQADLDIAKSAFHSAESQLKTAKTNLNISDRKVLYAEIKAPYSGYIIKKNVENGSFVSPTSGPLFIIGSVDKIKAYASVSQSDMRFFMKGKKVFLKVEGLAGKRFEGIVKRFSPSLDVSTRTLDIQIEFENREKLLKPGMFGRVTVIEEEKKPSILIDPRAVLRKRGLTFVYVVEKSKVKEREVQLGRILPDGKLEIISGVLEGEEIVVIGRDLVKEEMEVKTVPYSENKEL